MRRSVMAIMDRESAYAVNFMDHVNQRNTVPFEVQAFTDLGQLRSCMERRQVEILLIAEQDYDDCIRSWPIRQIVLLTEIPSVENAVKGEHEESWSGEEDRKMSDVRVAFPKIYKYQASSEIVRTVMTYYAEAGKPTVDPVSGALLKPRAKTIGIFSPVGRCMKTSLAMTLGMTLAKRKPTVLINMETCPGFRTLLKGERGKSISDIIYYIRQGEADLMPRILPVLRELQSLCYLPPFESAGELFGVETTEWRALLQVLRTDSTYEDIVLDLGEIPLLYPELLEECDVIYMPQLSGEREKECGPDRPAEAKMAEFLQMLKSASFSAVRTRIRRITLPPNLSAGGGDWFESLLYGQMGRIAEECAARDRL